jgi:hypothetical protein
VLPSGNTLAVNYFIENEQFFAKVIQFQVFVLEIERERERNDNRHKNTQHNDT